MTSFPLVSIIIPCYNVEQYVAACVNSVLKQSYKNWECIIINDGSADGTLDVIQTYQSGFPKVRIYSQDNAGLSATRNRGIDLAEGDFIFFLDSDDLLDDNALQWLVSSFDNNDIITGITVSSTIYDNRITKISHLYPPKKGACVFRNDHFEVLKTAMESALTPVAQNRLYRKDFLTENNLRFKEGILHEDELWFFETMLVARNVKFIDQETYYYRTDNLGSVTKNVSDRNLKSYVLILEEIVRKYSNHGRYRIIAIWYAVYIKKIFLDFAIREKSKLSAEIITAMENSLKENYLPLEKTRFLSRNNDCYYRTLNKLSLQNFSTIENYFFQSRINSLRKLILVLKINFFL